MKNNDSWKPAKVKKQRSQNQGQNVLAGENAGMDVSITRETRCG